MLDGYFLVGGRMKTWNLGWILGCVDDDLGCCGLKKIENKVCVCFKKNYMLVEKFCECQMALGNLNIKILCFNGVVLWCFG